MLDKAPATIQGKVQILDVGPHGDADFIHHDVRPREHPALPVVEIASVLAGATFRLNSFMEPTTHATATFAMHTALSQVVPPATTNVSSA